jgi:hypothetical protein
MPGGYGLKVETWIIAAILSMRLDHVFVERNHRCHNGIATGCGTELLRDQCRSLGIIEPKLTGDGVGSYPLLKRP